MLVLKISNTRVRSLMKCPARHFARDPILSALLMNTINTIWIASLSTNLLEAWTEIMMIQVFVILNPES